MSDDYIAHCSPVHAPDNALAAATDVKTPQRCGLSADFFGHLLCVSALPCMCVLAESFSPSCRTWKNHVHLWTSGHRGTDGITVDWVLNYKTACSTSATIKYRMAYTNWRNKQPDNHHNGENCVHVSLLNNYTWNDIPCHFGYCFVCENRGAS